MCVVVGCWLKLRKHYKMNPTKIDRFENKNWPVMMMTAKPQRNDERRRCLFVRANKIAIEIGKQYSWFYLFFLSILQNDLNGYVKKREERNKYFLCRATSTISCHVWSFRVKRFTLVTGNWNRGARSSIRFVFQNTYGYDFNKMFCFRLNNCAAIDKVGAHKRATKIY